MADLTTRVVASPPGQLLLIHGPSGARILALLGASALLLQVLITIFWPGDFTHFVLAIWLGVLGISIYAVELRLDQASLIFDRYPDLQKNSHKSILYVCIALSTIGRDWSPFGHAATRFLMASGFTYAAVWFLKKHKRIGMSTQLDAANTDVNAQLREDAETSETGDSNPTGFLRFDESSPGPGRYEQV